MKRPTLTTVIGLVLVLGVMVAAQAVIGTFHVRKDLTGNKRYTLSDVSKKQFQSLDDLLTVNVYLSDRLPQELVNIRQDIEDLLRECRTYSNGRVNYRFRDPTGSEELKAKAQEEGIMEAPFVVIEQDQQTTIQGFMGMSLTYKGKRESIPVFTPEILGNLEYEIVSRVMKLTRKETPVIGFTTGHGEAGADSTQVIRQQLQEQYAVRDVDMATGGAIPSDITTLVIAGPTSPFTTRDLYYLDQFQMSGGNVVALIDPIESPMQSAMPKKAPHGMDTWLANLGVQLTNQLVGDQFSSVVQFSMGRGMAVMQYPLFVQTIAQGVNKDFAPVANVGTGVLLPWVAEMKKAAVPDGLELVEVLNSSPRSWTMGEPYELNPSPTLLGRAPDGQQHLLAVMVQGKVPTLYEGDELPEGVEDDGSRLKQAQKETSTLIIGTSKLLDDNLVMRRRDVNNTAFLLNLFDHMTLGGGLSDIRARNQMVQRIDPTKVEVMEGPKDNPKTVSRVPRLKILYTSAMPLLILVVWVLRSVMNGRARKAYEEALGA